MGIAGLSYSTMCALFPGLQAARHIPALLNHILDFDIEAHEYLTLWKNSTLKFGNKISIGDCGWNL